MKGTSVHELTAKDIQVGRCYEARRHRRYARLFADVWNDRQVLWINPLRTQVQYDSPTVADGRHYPRVSMEAFLKWAGRDVTELMPPKDWRPWKARPQSRTQA